MHRKGMIHRNGMFFLINAEKGTCTQVAGPVWPAPLKLRRKYR